ncbi:MAG: YoaK family protein [Candidatus Acidiferrales bacterium]
MPLSDSLAKHKSKIVVALILTFSSGMVDIVAFLGIFPLFTAHLTGTTVHLGQSLVLGKRTEIIAAAAIVAAFFGGSVLGRTIIEASVRRGFRRVATITLAVEAAILAFVGVAGASLGHTRAPAHVYFYLALLAGAMGMQTATLTGIGPLTVHTTFVTGTVNKLAQLVSRILFRSYDFLRGHGKTPENRAAQSAESTQAIFIFSIWMCYLMGAIGGTASYMRWGIRALFVPIVGMVIGIIADIFRPLSIEEEHEQSER